MKSKIFFEKQFKRFGLNSQRLYPNEEFCRYLGKYKNNIYNQNINCLEVGVGSGANLKPMLDLKLNIDAIDISQTSIKILKRKYSGKKINFKALDMLKIHELNKSYHFIFDIFSSYSMPTEKGKIFIRNVSKCLKKGGKFFSFFPSKKSDTWLKSSKQNRLDSNTLKKIDKKNLPYYGNNYPFRFHTKKEYFNILKKENIEMKSCETLMRTYNNGKIKFFFLIIEGEKK